MLFFVMLYEQPILHLHYAVVKNKIHMLSLQPAIHRNGSKADSALHQSARNSKLAADIHKFDSLFDAC